jgi:hypothetical protein
MLSVDTKVAFQVLDKKKSWELLKQELEGDGWSVLVVENFSIRDKSSFFEAVRQYLPLDPPLVSNRSWEALSDSLWEGISDLDSAKVALFFPGLQALALEHPKEFDLASQVLADVAESLSRTPLDDDREKIVRVLFWSS